MDRELIERLQRYADPEDLRVGTNMVRDALDEATRAAEADNAEIAALRAALRAVLEGLEQPSDAMKKALVDLALNIKLGGGYTWPDYAADMCKTVAAQLRKDAGL